MNDELSQIVDAGDLHRYRTELPNLIDDMNLSPYSYRLYGHYKRVAGDSGKCWQSRDTIAKACNMSAGMVTKARDELVKARLINVKTSDNPNGGKDFVIVTIRDIWFENFKRYRPTSPDDGENEAMSPGDIEGEIDLGEAMSPGDIKNKTIKGKEHKEKKNPLTAGKKRPAGSAASEPGGITHKHPAIQAIKQLTNHYPPKELWPELVGYIGDHPDFKKLEGCRAEWLRRGYNGNAWAWAEAWYTEGIPQRMNGNGNGHAKPNEPAGFAGLREYAEKEGLHGYQG